MPNARFRLTAALLALVTVVAFWPVKDGQFVSIDDLRYVVNNPAVRGGLTVKGLAWAFTTLEAANWHPLTWLSHMADVSLFGLDAGAHHLVNLGLHVLNTVLLFLLLTRMTGSLWPSALAAALFAVHPLHVESVAWISERKDVLSTFFWMLTCLAYLGYVRRPRPSAYGHVMIIYVLGLMAKPMLVTLPFVLLILDGWPLGRLRRVENGSAPAGPVAAGVGRGFRPEVLLEKVPLLAAAAASSAVTLMAQHQGMMIKSFEAYSFDIRWKNSVFAYLRYLGKTFWPAELIIPYRHLGRSLGVWQAGGALLALAAVTAAVWMAGRRSPYMPAGWLWFLGSLFPVIGLVQISDQGLADRYTYIPLIGLFIALSWGAAALAERIPRGVPAFGAAAFVIIGLLVVLTWRQAGYWRDNGTLFGHTAEVLKSDNMALDILRDRQRRNPGIGAPMVEVETGMGDTLMQRQKFAEAAGHYRKALEFDPRQDAVRAKLGAVLLHLGQVDEAIGQFAAAVEAAPRNAAARANLGLALRVRGRDEEALLQLREALKLDPANEKAQANLNELTLKK